MTPAASTALARARVEVDAELCKGCGLCVVVCPGVNLRLAPTFNRGGFHPAQFAYHGERGDCTGCGLCYWVCPDFAIVEVGKLRA